MDEQQEDYKSLPIIDRLSHKVWKARVSAYEELVTLFRTSDKPNDFYPYESHLKKMATDVNAVAQEAGLNAVLHYVENAPSAANTRDAVVPALVEKCFGAARAGTKAKANDIILMYAEVDVADPVVELIIPGINAKQPKAVVQTVATMRELIRQFGVKTANPKPILKVIPKLFGHADKNVRAEASALTIELYRWIGPAVNQFLSELKPVQVKELEESFSQLPQEKAVPVRLLRSQQELVQANSENNADDDVEMDDEAAQQDDEEDTSGLDLVDPVDILSKLPQDFFELLTSKKWQERKEALEQLLAAAKTPKIAEREYSELMSALAKATNCIEEIANGLRQSFHRYKGTVLPPLIDKLKERKPQVLEQLFNAAAAVFAVIAFEEVVEEVTSGAKHKNPQVRAQCIKLLVVSLSKIRQIPGKGEIKTVAELMLKTIDDADSATRENSAEGLGTLTKVVGEKAMAPFLEKLDDIKATKVKEACDKAVVKAKPAGPSKVSKPAPAAAPPKRAQKPKAAVLPKPPADDMALDDDYELPRQPSPPKRKPPPRALASATAAKKPALSSMAKSSSAAVSSSATPKKPAAKLPPSAPEEPVRYRFSPEDAEERITAYVPENIMAEIADSQWKIRLAAMESLYSHIEAMDPSEIEPEIIIRVLSKKPGWKEMNFQVMGKLFNTMQLLAGNSKFSKACAAIGVPGLTEKLGDIKLKKHAGDCLIAFAEKTSLQFVLSQAYPMWRKQKSPKVLADSLTWLHTAIMEFGIRGLQIRDVIDFLKYALTNTNASVRTSAVLVLGALRLYIGPEVKSFVQDVSPALLATIEAEFDKVASMEPPKPSKGNVDEAEDNNNDAIESLFPRVDISSQLSKVSSDCNDANWKVRKEGLEKTLAIINEANKRIKPSLGDFPAVLKQRLNDSNKNLQILTLEITGLLAISMGKPFERYVKTVASPVISVLTDNKANVRAAGVACLVNLQTICGLESLISAIANGLSSDSPTLRKDLLTWLDETLKGGATADLSPLISGILSCLQDRNAEVRKTAQSCLPFVISSAGYDQVMSKASDLKAAQRQTILPFIEAAKGQSKSNNSINPVPSTVSRGKLESRRLTDTSDLEERTILPKPRTMLKKKPTVARSLGGTPTSRSPAQSAAMSPASSSTPDDSAAPILTAEPGQKLVRAKKENRWQFESPRQDVLDSLQSQIGSNFSPSLIRLMFSKSQHADRDFLAALNMLDECLVDPELCSTKYRVDFSDMKQRYIANADLVFKYLTIRFFDTSTSMLIKCLDLTEHLIAVMEEESYHLSEYEATSFLPFLINKVGDPKETMRVRIRGILATMCRIYPGSKMFNHLLEVTANSKNAKARAECLEEVSALIQRNGVSVMLPQKSLPIIAGHISDRDAGVRNAALGAVAQAYTLIGDPVYKYVGRLSEKDMSMVEERLKRTKTNVSSAPAQPKRTTATDDLHNEQSLPHSELPRPSRLSLNKGKLSLPRPRQYAQPRAEVEPMAGVEHEPEREMLRPSGQSFLPEPRGVRSPPKNTSISPEHNEYMMDFLITQITSGDPHPSIDALKKLDKILSTQPEMVIPDVDALVNAITLQVRLAFSALDGRSAPLTRLCKHLVNALVLLFSNRQLATHVSQDALHRLLQELAHRLLDVDMLSVETGPQLSKALNVAMVKVLEFSDRNASISALLAILVNCAAELRPGDSTTSKESRFTELIMKCLWKLSKTIQEHMRNGSINPDQLLLDINNFFVATPPTEWKQRAAEQVPFGEMPLRTAKTLILELITGLGDSVFDHLTLIDDPQRSCVYPYLHHMLQARRKKHEVDQQATRSPQPEHKPRATADEQPHEPDVQRASRPTSIVSANDMNGSRPVSIADSADSFENASAKSIPHNTLPVSEDAPMEDVQRQLPASSQANSDSKALTDVEMNNLLTQIFVKIGTREKTKQGIVELYEFQKKYPHAETKVNAYLSQTGNYFQSYIRRGLNNLSAEDDSLKANAANTFSEDTKEPSSNRSFDDMSPRSSRPQSTVEDPAEIKQRLLRLQQKFGYRTESDETDLAAGFNNIQKRASTLSLEPTQRESDRTQSVSALKERLARMKRALDSSIADP
ncbi:hypothetical protein VKS41_003168 [Umbelopsis sp. WA50703]